MLRPPGPSLVLCNAAQQSQLDPQVLLGSCEGGLSSDLEILLGALLPSEALHWSQPGIGSSGFAGAYLDTIMHQAACNRTLRPGKLRAVQCLCGTLQASITRQRNTAAP